MDCCICLAAIEAGTSSATTSCGHHFHFGCLATWSKTKTTCPLCRQAFTETDTPAERPPIEDDDFSIPRPGYTRELLSPREWLLRIPPATPWTARLREQLQERRTLYPENADIPFIMEKASVDAQTAKAYLAFYKDPVEVITHVGWGGDCFPIPTFRERERPALLEPYVSRDIQSRTGITALTLQLHDDGYESV